MAAGGERDSWAPDPLGSKNLQQAGTLQLLAELAVAFAGFTGLVGALRINRDEKADVRGELRVLIEFALFLMLSSLVPLFLWEAGVSGDSSWRLASLAHVAFSFVYYLRRWESLADSASSSGKTQVMFVTVAVEGPLAALLLANGLGILPWAPHVAYLATLFYQLVGTSLSFMRFASPLWREPDA